SSELQVWIRLQQTLHRRNGAGRVPLDVFQCGLQVSLPLFFVEESTVDKEARLYKVASRSVLRFVAVTESTLEWHFLRTVCHLVEMCRGGTMSETEADDSGYRFSGTRHSPKPRREWDKRLQWLEGGAGEGHCPGLLPFTSRSHRLFSVEGRRRERNVKAVRQHARQVCLRVRFFVRLYAAVGRDPRQEKIPPGFANGEEVALHIPRIMRNIGPLINVWCMRMEGKHMPVVKIPANSQPNSVNPPLTIAMRYSPSLAAKFLGEKSFPPEVIFHTDESLLRNAENFNDFRDVLPDGYADGISVKNVNICGTLYDTGMALVFTYQHDLPVFGRIEHFVKPLGEEKCFFVLKAYKTVGYSNHKFCCEATKGILFYQL
ncbi:Sulfate adenylyltransferase, partial [Frankliniella fusca]